MTDRSLRCTSYRRAEHLRIASTGATPQRAVWPTSMQSPIRSSNDWIASQGSEGEGQTLSSDPWVGMASRLSYSLTLLSRTGNGWRVVLDTHVGWRGGGA